VSAEGIILFDEIQEKTVFAEVPPEFSSTRQIALGGMFVNMAKRLSHEFKAGSINSVVISCEEKLICISKREHQFIIVLYPKNENIEDSTIIQKTSEIFDNILKNDKIKN